MTIIRRNIDTLAIVTLAALLLVFGNGCAAFSTTKPQGLTPRVRYIQLEAGFNAAIDALDVAAKAGKIPQGMKADLKLAVIAASGALDAAAPVVSDPNAPLVSIDNALAAVQVALDRLAAYRLQVESKGRSNGSISGASGDSGATHPSSDGGGSGQPGRRRGSGGEAYRRA